MNLRFSPVAGHLTLLLTLLLKLLKCTFVPGRLVTSAPKRTAVTNKASRCAVWVTQSHGERYNKRKNNANNKVQQRCVICEKPACKNTRWRWMITCAAWGSLWTVFPTHKRQTLHSPAKVQLYLCVTKLDIWAKVVVYCHTKEGWTVTLWLARAL